MKFLTSVFLLLILFISNSAFSQSSDDLSREANTEYVFVQDNSPYAIAQRELIALRKSGNEQQYLAKLQQVMNQFPDKYIQSSPFDNNKIFKSVGPDPIMKNIPAYETDWNSGGDNVISPGGISSPTSGNPTANNRMIRMTADSNGVLFVAFIEQGRDTLIFYSSTDQGMHWTQINRVTAGGGLKYQGFDIAVTDTNGGTGSKIGMVVSIVPTGDNYNGTVYYADMLSDGTGFAPSLVEAPVGGYGRISPCIVTDGWNWSPGSTYWYVAYQSANTGSGVTTAAICALTPNWGSTWQYDTARATFNDYELDINYNFGADSIYVLLTNNLTTTNPNLRLRWTALGNWGTNVSWKQFNPATTGDPEFDGQFAVNRGNNNAVVTYTVTSGATNNVNYSYALTGYVPWSTGNPIVNQANDVERASIFSLPQQDGSFRVAFVSQGASFDTVIYYNTFSVGSGFGARQVVNQNDATPSLKPVIAAGFYPSAFATIVFAGFGPTGLYADGSAIVTEITPVGNNVPEAYKLGQNYPNPFNPSTTISFSIPKNQIVTLKVYDILGKEVATLVNSELNAGQYNVNLNATNLGSGIYFYTIKAGDFTETKKMMLVK